MAVTKAVNNNLAVDFRDTIIRELVRQNMFTPYMGDGAGSLIRTFSQTAKTGGDVINIPFATSLHAPGVGNGILSGNEEAIVNSGFRLWLDWARNAVKISKAELKKMSVNIFDYARPMLSDWGKQLQRDEIVLALLSIPSEAAPNGYGSAAGQRVNGTLWSQATASQKNTWMDHNSDRVLFGAARGNYVAGNFASSIANVDTTNDKASAGIVRVMKAMAEGADPQITPLNMDDGYDRTVLFVGPNAFRDLAADAAIYAANKDARPREGMSYKNNPIFNDGDLLYQGVIIRKVPQIARYHKLAGIGASGSNVEPMFMVGASGVAFVYGHLPEPTELDDTDYDFYEGKGIQMAYGIGKTFIKTPAGQLKDWGVVTAFVSSVDDA